MKNSFEKKFNKIFISYASEDYEYAKQIYDYLDNTSYSPWLDKEKILVGQDWDLEIKKNLSTSDFIIILISKTSLKKRGYIQKEFKLASELMEEKLESDIFILPISLEEKLTDEKFKHLQHLYFHENFFQKKIQESLNHQRLKYFEDNLLIKNIEDTFILQESKYKFNIKDFPINFSCHFPEFLENPVFDSNEINSIIQGKIVEEILEYRLFSTEDPSYFETGAMKNSHIELEITGNIHYISNKIISISIITHSYFGGAHPNTYIKTINFLLNPLRILKFSNLYSVHMYDGSLIRLLEKYNPYKHLKAYFKYINDENIPFLINDKEITIECANFVPRVILAESSITIPLSEDIKNKYIISN
ncbi:toll/interleukin-1 receptor domain-containing protein [Acinetobacter calcoaceticus]|uniref:toll/interleukin-1 receptor domain-containing protein n=1 Tax=Acinetobacter calcoaceticus TaxID=471 RepID=UPI003AF633D9